MFLRRAYARDLRCIDRPSIGRSPMEFSGCNLAFVRIHAELSRSALAKKISGSHGCGHVNGALVRTWEDYCGGCDFPQPNVSQFLELCGALKCEPEQLCETTACTASDEARQFGPGGWLAWKNGTGPSPQELSLLPGELREESRRGVLSPRAARWLARRARREADRTRRALAKRKRDERSWAATKKVLMARRAARAEALRRKRLGLPPTRRVAACRRRSPASKATA
jgi:hypothetical protein